MHPPTSKRILDGVAYEVRQDMVRSARPQSPIVRLMQSALTIGVGLPVFALVAPLWYLLMLNRSISQRLSAIFIPIAMKSVDKGFASIKKELLKGLHGRVLDVGCGAGDWLKYFGNASFVTELEPNPFHGPKIAQNVEVFKRDHANVEIEVVHKFVGELDPSKPYDYIVFGNVMCEVPDQKSFLQDIDKVLKPGGKIVFQEHIRRPRGTVVGVLQDVFNVWWCKASDGCNCNRETVEVMKTMPGWKIEYWDLHQDAPIFVDRMAVGIITKLPSSSTGDAISKM